MTGNSTIYAGGLFSIVHGYPQACLAALQAAPEISAVQPASGGNNGSVTISVTGRNLAPGAAVNLLQSLSSFRTATMVSVAPDGMSLTATLDLTGAATGAWDVAVQNPDLQQATLPNGFTINSLAAPQLQIALLPQPWLVPPRRPGDKSRAPDSSTPVWIPT